VKVKATRKEIDKFTLEGWWGGGGGLSEVGDSVCTVDGGGLGVYKYQIDNITQKYQ
jgi:hypothetical protein